MMKFHMKLSCTCHCPFFNKILSLNIKKIDFCFIIYNQILPLYWSPFVRLRLENSFSVVKERFWVSGIDLFRYYFRLSESIVVEILQLFVFIMEGNKAAPVGWK